MNFLYSLLLTGSEVAIAVEETYTTPSLYLDGGFVADCASVATYIASFLRII